MSRAAAPDDISVRPLAPQVASSAVVIGHALPGDGSLLSEGDVVRSPATSVAIGTGSAVIENAVVVGATDMPPDDGEATIHRVIALPPDVPGEQRARLAEVAETTPVTIAVRAGTPITTTIAVSGR